MEIINHTVLFTCEPNVSIIITNLNKIFKSTIDDDIYLRISGEVNEHIVIIKPKGKKRKYYTLKEVSMSPLNPKKMWFELNPRKDKSE